MKAIILTGSSAVRSIEVLESIEARLGPCAREAVGVAVTGMSAARVAQAQLGPEVSQVLQLVCASIEHLATMHHGVTAEDIKAVLQVSDLDAAEAMKKLNQGERP